jgi:hypothetical protein
VGVVVRRVRCGRVMRRMRFGLLLRRGMGRRRLLWVVVGGRFAMSFRRVCRDRTRRRLVALSMVVVQAVEVVSIVLVRVELMRVEVAGALVV